MKIRCFDRMKGDSFTCSVRWRIVLLEDKEVRNVKSENRKRSEWYRRIRHNDKSEMSRLSGKKPHFSRVSMTLFSINFSTWFQHVQLHSSECWHANWNHRRTTEVQTSAQQTFRAMFQRRVDTIILTVRRSSHSKNSRILTNFKTANESYYFVLFKNLLGPYNFLPHRCIVYANCNLHDLTHSSVANLSVMWIVNS